MYKDINDKWQATVTNEEILGFFGEYNWLSNFYKSPILIDGILYPSSEHAYMAMKVLDRGTRMKIAEFKTSAEAKRFGQKIPLRPNWDQLKLVFMYKVLYAKFSQNKTLHEKLIKTGDKYLEESNWWRDTYWGVYWKDGIPEGNREGQNMLGKVLMAVREELRVNEIYY